MGSGHSSGYDYYDWWTDYYYPRDPVIVEPTDPDPADLDTLKVDSVDFEVDQNVEDHHTNEYDVTQQSTASPGEKVKLVIRRGQPFTISVNFNRDYDRSHDDIRLLFTTGDNPSSSRGTKVEFTLSDKDHPGQWGATLTLNQDKVIKVKIFTPPECIVGKWSFKVHVVKKADDNVTVTRFEHKEPIYILFNPWCKDDSVYMGDKAKRDEYVLNEHGAIWRGSYYNFSPKPWVFGQFTGNVLYCCVDLLDKVSSRGTGNLKITERGDPVKVARHLSAVVNSSDEGGVLMGNWSGEYSDGVSPLAWSGSKAILEQYYKQKSPVKYGQCWVFSGVLTTVLRALGLPARSVTNFASAHDVDANVIMEYFYGYDEDGDLDRISHLCRDSIWNFHVWNEAWMTRPDLPSGYDGWQAVDSTPQEASQGIYRCGPFPVSAIKEGRINLNYDGPFIFAEVNADRVNWKKDGDNLTLMKVFRAEVGKKMSTRSLSGGRDDVTAAYKHREGTREERGALRVAQKHSQASRTLLDDPYRDVDFKLDYDAQNIFVGSDFTLKVHVHNKKDHTRTVKGKVTVRIMLYTGREADVVTRHKLNMELDANQSVTEAIPVTEADYVDKLKDMCMLSFTLTADVQENPFEFFALTEDCRLRKPHLNITGPPTATKGQEMTIEMEFTNPLSRPLTDCYLEWESDGFRDGKKAGLGTVGPQEKWTYSLPLTPTRKGEREVVLSFNSKQLEDVNGTFDVTVS